MEWRDGEQQQKERTRSAINKPRDQFITRLLARVKQQQPRSEPCPGGPNATDCTEESWEDLADTEEEDKEDKKTEMEEEEKSRSLFFMLRGSELAVRY